jgi:hypothetical protein
VTGGTLGGLALPARSQPQAARRPLEVDSKLPRRNAVTGYAEELLAGDHFMPGEPDDNLFVDGFERLGGEGYCSTNTCGSSRSIAHWPVSTGNRTSDTARRFSISEGRISQLREDLKTARDAFIGETEPPQAAAVAA